MAQKTQLGTTATPRGKVQSFSAKAEAVAESGVIAKYVGPVYMPRGAM